MDTVTEVVKQDNVKNKEISEDNKSRETVTVFPVSCIFWILFGVIVGSSIGTPLLQDIIDAAYGYRWNYVERCIVDEGYFAGGYCRTPLNCSCWDVDQIDDVDINDITEEQYKQRYAYSNRPLVIRNAAANWKALQVLDYEWLKTEYLRNPDVVEESWDNCFFKCYKTSEFKSLADVFHISSERIAGISLEPWYVGWSVCHQSVLSQLSSLISLPNFLENFQVEGNMWIFLGTPGYGAHLHLDHDLDLPTWQAQISGSKTWYLKPPPECASTCPGLIQTDMHPGDMIIVNTNFWMHSTEVLDNGISLVITRQLS